MLEKLKIKYYCFKYGIDNYIINDDLSIDVNGDVYIQTKKCLPSFIRFRNVFGNFIFIGDNFTNRIDISEFSGFPNFIEKDLHINYCKIKSLVGITQEIGHDVYLHSNQIESLEGCPKRIKGDFGCHFNLLTTLVGGPEEVCGDYVCSDNPLHNLDGLGIVHKRFHTSKEDLFTFDHMDHVYGDLVAYKSPIGEIYSLNPRIEFIQLVNEYSAIQIVNGDPTIIKKRLERALIDTGKIPKKLKFQHYFIQ